MQEPTNKLQYVPNQMQHQSAFASSYPSISTAPMIGPNGLPVQRDPAQPTSAFEARYNVDKFNTQSIN